ncbi:MAG: spermidine/putrescine ABC transporter substrate-binding protein [Clostridia bacterium]|nr:spermidine/putrescine ABC transporter substrate-binding protein [Clostridia bacterium]
MKKRIISFALAIVTVALVLFSSASCGSVRTLNVYNWGQYISDGADDSLDVNKAFEEWYLKTYNEKIKVNYTTFASCEDMYAKLKSGAVSYDVVVPSDYMIQQMISEDMLEKLDFNNIPNYVYIADEFKDSESSINKYDPNHEYSVPYTYGMVGVIYNTEKVPTDQSSWSLLWDPDYSGQILNFNNPRDAFGTAMYKLGIDVNTTSAEEWQKALDSLKNQKQYVQSYVMDEIFNKMKSGSAAIAPYYAGDFFTMYADNDKLAFYYPTEGTNIFIDAMCIPKGSANKDLAEAYINFMLSEEPAVANAEYICYASPNTQVRDNEEYKEYLAELHPDAYDILYTRASEVKTSSYAKLDSDTQALMNSLWEELKVESSVGGGVFLFCAILVVVLAAVITVLVIRKKKRSGYDDLYDDDKDEEDDKKKKKNKK